MWSNSGHVFTREETRAELETLGTLSTIACFMYRSMACNMVVCVTEKRLIIHMILVIKLVFTVFLL